MASLKVKFPARLLLPLAAIVLGSCVLGSCAVAPVQEVPVAPPRVAYGHAVQEADLARWNIDIRTQDGMGLPPGHGNALEGKGIYEQKCLSCHGADAKGGPVYGTMVGGIGSFTTNTRVLTPGSMYPYAPILFDYIRRSMPMDKPQSLTANEVYALSAYLLNLNGLVPADAQMDANALPKVAMPN